MGSKAHTDRQTRRLYYAFANLRVHVESEFLEDTVIALLISLVKIAPRHSFADAEVVGFSRMSSHRHNHITQTLTI